MHKGVQGINNNNTRKINIVVGTLTESVLYFNKRLVAVGYFMQVCFKGIALSVNICSFIATSHYCQINHTSSLFFVWLTLNNLDS